MGIQKRLFRSSKNKFFAGVCGGLGDFFGIDPTIVRLIWGILTIVSLGFGVLAYIAAWLIIPKK